AQPLEQAFEPRERHEPAARQLAVEALLLVGVAAQLVVGQRASEEHGEDVTVALAVQLAAAVFRSRGINPRSLIKLERPSGPPRPPLPQSVSLHEDFERL